MTPLLTIIIATKNREFYCIEAIKTILAINSDQLQLAIADNSDSEKVKEFVASISDDRIIYKYDNSPKSSIDNFNECISLASGEYISMVGDDDSVLPVILDIAKWAKFNNVDSVSSSVLIQYYWPGAYKNFDNGLLIFPLNESKIKRIDSKKIANKLIKNGIINHYSYPIPRTYHGLVKRDLMNQIKSNTGFFYGGLSPDIYSSFALLSIVKNHYHFSLPFTIAGVCDKSTTAENLVGRHSGELKDMPHLKNRENYIWDINIPKYYSVYTTWCESALKALSDMGEVILYKKFNIYPLLAIGILTNWKYIFKITITKTEEIRITKNKNFIGFWLKIMFHMVLQVIIRMFRTLKDKFYLRKTKVTNIPYIKEAISIISSNKLYSERVLNPLSEIKK